MYFEMGAPLASTCVSAYVTREKGAPFLGGALWQRWQTVVRIRSTSHGRAPDGAGFGLLRSPAEHATTITPRSGQMYLRMMCFVQGLAQS